MYFGMSEIVSTRTLTNRLKKKGGGVHLKVLMPNLTTASDIRLGTTPVGKVYAGTQQIWPLPSPGNDIIQQNTGIWSGTSMSVSVPGPTAPTSTMVFIIAGNTIVATPSGWTLRESQVNEMGHYLFTRMGSTNSWNITTNNGAGTWYVAEVASSTYEASASANDPTGSHEYATPTLTPLAGHRLLLASVASSSGDEIQRTISDWTDNFTEIADICNPTGDYPMQGVALRDVSTDGVTGYMTTASYSQGVGTRSAIIASFIL